jgi:hypothetical protein
MPNWVDKLGAWATGNCWGVGEEGKDGWHGNSQKGQEKGLKRVERSFLHKDKPQKFKQKNRFI